jgi:hypothetical protein
MSARHLNGQWVRLAFCTLIAGLFLLGSVTPAPARERGGREMESSPGRERGGHEHQFLDSRYRHDRYYPERGFAVRALPRTSHEIIHNGRRFYFDGGSWYRHAGGRFLVVAPPFGLIIPFLPPYYTTVWIGAVPYYYANDVYYMQGGNGYVVVAPPQGEVKPTPPVAADQFFIYPRQGQNEKQQADDRYACHLWAVSQTGYDPTQPPPDPSTNVKQKRDDYQRAMAACLEGRGYTVK